MISLDINELFNILEEEKTSDKLVKLNPNFIDDLREEIESLKSFVLNSKDLDEISSKIEELEKIKKTLLKILELRKEKIFNYIKIGDYEIENLLDFEEDFVLAIKKAFKEYQHFIDNILTENKKRSDKKKIRILHSLPRFLSSDGNEYGPYEQGEIIVLPEREANLLISRNMAEEIND